MGINHRIPAFTLIEVLVSIAILGVLIALLLPAIGRARDQAKLTQCATSMRSIGQALFVFAGEHRDRLPLNIRPWHEVELDSRSTTLRRSGGDQWAWQLHRVLGQTTPPWLADLRCPTAALGFPTDDRGADYDPEARPGSCWLLNAYCSDRLLASIPAPGRGVLVQESGVWESMSSDTVELEFPSQPWRYPHPRVTFNRGTGRWGWLPGRRQRPKHNILWCDGHVDARAARTWEQGDGSHGADRIKHMRFGLPGNHPLDP